MEMTKKERAEFGALRWTSPVERDVMPPSLSNFRTTDTKGWDFLTIDRSVELCWSSSVSHGYCAADGIGCNGSRSLFSTKAKALAALRHELERMAAADLLNIDKMIAEEVNGGSEQ